MTKAQAHWNQTRIRMVRLTDPICSKSGPAHWWPSHKPSQAQPSLTQRSCGRSYCPCERNMSFLLSCQCRRIQPLLFFVFFFRWQRFYSSKFGFIDHPFIRAVNRAGSGSGLIERLNLRSLIRSIFWNHGCQLIAYKYWKIYFNLVFLL